jgi:hypothetical protein
MRKPSRRKKARNTNIKIAWRFWSVDALQNQNGRAAAGISERKLQSVRQTGMLAFLSSIQGAVSGQLAAADCWTMGRFGDFQVAQLNTNSPQGERATEKHDWDARAARLMFRHEMDHA